MTTYRVVLVNLDGSLSEEQFVAASTPDKAAEIAAGMKLKRGTNGVQQILRAKVYWDNGGPTMARFYEPDPVVLRLVP